MTNGRIPIRGGITSKERKGGKMRRRTAQRHAKPHKRRKPGGKEKKLGNGVLVEIAGKYHRLNSRRGGNKE